MQLIVNVNQKECRVTQLVIGVHILYVRTLWDETHKRKNPAPAGYQTTTPWTPFPYPRHSSNSANKIIHARRAELGPIYWRWCCSLQVTALY